MGEKRQGVNMVKQEEVSRRLEKVEVWGKIWEKIQDRILKERETFPPIWEMNREGKKEKEKQGEGLIVILLFSQVNY